MIPRETGQKHMLSFNQSFSCTSKPYVSYWLYANTALFFSFLEQSVKTCLLKGISTVVKSGPCVSIFTVRASMTNGYKMLTAMTHGCDGCNVILVGDFDPHGLVFLPLTGSDCFSKCKWQSYRKEPFGQKHSLRDGWLLRLILRLMLKFWVGVRLDLPTQIIITRWPSNETSLLLNDKHLLFWWRKKKVILLHLKHVLQLSKLDRTCQALILVFLPIL